MFPQANTEVPRVVTKDQAQQLSTCFKALSAYSYKVAQIFNEVKQNQPQQNPGVYGYRTSSGSFATFKSRTDPSTVNISRPSSFYQGPTKPHPLNFPVAPKNDDMKKDSLRNLQINGKSFMIPEGVFQLFKENLSSTEEQNDVRMTQNSTMPFNDFSSSQQYDEDFHPDFYPGPTPMTARQRAMYNAKASKLPVKEDLVPSPVKKQTEKTEAIENQSRLNESAATLNNNPSEDDKQSAVKENASLQLMKMDTNEPVSKESIIKPIIKQETTQQVVRQDLNHRLIIRNVTKESTTKPITKEGSQPVVKKDSNQPLSNENSIVKSAKENITKSVVNDSASQPRSKGRPPKSVSKDNASKAVREKINQLTGKKGVKEDDSHSVDVTEAVVDEVVDSKKSNAPLAAKKRKSEPAGQQRSAVGFQSETKVVEKPAGATNRLSGKKMEAALEALKSRASEPKGMTNLKKSMELNCNEKKDQLKEFCTVESAVNDNAQNEEAFKSPQKKASPIRKSIPLKSGPLRKNESKSPAMKSSTIVRLSLGSSHIVESTKQEVKSNENEMTSFDDTPLKKIKKMSEKDALTFDEVAGDIVRRQQSSELVNEDWITKYYGLRHKLQNTPGTESLLIHFITLEIAELGNVIFDKNVDQLNTVRNELEARIAHERKSLHELTKKMHAERNNLTPEEFEALEKKIWKLREQLNQLLKAEQDLDNDFQIYVQAHQKSQIPKMSRNMVGVTKQQVLKKLLKRLMNGISKDNEDDTPSKVEVNLGLEGSNSEKRAKRLKDSLDNDLPDRSKKKRLDEQMELM